MAVATVKTLKEKEKKFVLDFLRPSADDIGPFDLFWVLVISGVIGCLIETIYMWITTGFISNRSSDIFFPISMVWGIGCMLFTFLFYKDSKKKAWKIFIKGFFVGGIFEYCCGIFCEKMWGVVFWDYSSWPLSFGKHTNVIFMCFWGLVVVGWTKLICPRLLAIISKIPRRIGRIVTTVLCIYLCLTCALTAEILYRRGERQKGIAPQNFLETWCDQNYNDEKLKEVFPFLENSSSDANSNNSNNAVPKTSSSTDGLEKGYSLGEVESQDGTRAA